MELLLKNYAKFYAKELSNAVRFVNRDAAAGHAALWVITIKFSGIQPAKII
jgi:hypothetical protein